MADLEADVGQPPSHGSDATPGGSWTVDAISGFRITSPYVAHDPVCPSGPHPTRHCRCRVFRTRSLAWSYISQIAKGEQGE